MRPRIATNHSTALVTGAGSGIGRATALALARRGANVIAADIDPLTAKTTAAACADLGVDATAEAVDVADRDAMVAMRERLADAGVPPIDLLVNNAGVGSTGAFAAADPEDWDWIRSINLDGVVHGCQVFGPGMIARRRGQIVNVSSGLAVAPMANTVAYSTTKAGVLMFSRALRNDWRRHRVGVSVVLPGVIRTNIVEGTRISGGDQDRMRGLARRMFSFGHDPRMVARVIAETAHRNRAVANAGFEARLGWYLAKILPQPAAELIGRPLPRLIVGTGHSGS